MAEGSSSKPLTVIDKLHGESVQVGDNNKKHLYNNCIFHIHHHHHHHHHHLPCGNRCNSLSPPGQDHVSYTRDQVEIDMEVLRNMDQQGEIVGESVHSVIQSGLIEETQNPSSSAIPIDTMKIIDTWGCELRIGDVVGLHSIFSYLFPTAIYVGDGMIVRCDEDTGLIVKEELNLRKTFYKRGVTYGSVPVYCRVERVKRAEGRVGDTFTEGHKKDFVCWCFTGVTNMKALSKAIFGP